IGNPVAIGYLYSLSSTRVYGRAPFSNARKKMKGLAVEPIGRGDVAILMLYPFATLAGLGEPTTANTSFSGILITAIAPFRAPLSQAASTFFLRISRSLSVRFLSKVVSQEWTHG